VNVPKLAPLPTRAKLLNEILLPNCNESRTEILPAQRAKPLSDNVLPREKASHPDSEPPRRTFPVTLTLEPILAKLRTLQVEPMCTKLMTLMRPERRPKLLTEHDDAKFCDVITEVL
jgi:hypothetical protein